MLPFFRRVRKQLADDNQALKYLRYAIGETVLVVVGILIALSINNWNESNKQKKFEQEILRQIQTNLTKDQAKLKVVKASFQNAISSIDKLLNYNGATQEKDSLKYWLGDIIQFDRFQPLTNAYEVLKSNGLDHIRNHQLRFLLGTYYDDEVNHVIKSLGDVELVFLTYWHPILQKEVLAFKFKDYVIIRDFDIFKKSSPARNLLITNRDNFGGGLNRLDNVIEKTEKIQKLIDLEIK